MECATCRIEILDEPILVEGAPYCCPGCAAGGPCSCSDEETPFPPSGNGRLALRGRRTAPDPSGKGH